MRYLDRTLPTCAENLALDEALLITADEQDEGPVLRFWEPDALAVVLGATCRLHDDVHVATCRSDGVPIARRSSGGGTVVVGPGTLNVTVVLPADGAPGLGAVDRAQLYVLERTAAALRSLRPEISVQGLGDLTLERRPGCLQKFAGSAQRRLRRYFFVHMTIMNRFPLDRIVKYTPLPRRQPPYRAGRSHEEFLTNLDVPRDELIAAIRSAWLDRDGPPAPAEIPEVLAKQLLKEKFSKSEWIERL